MERKPNMILRYERLKRGWTQSRLADELNTFEAKDEIRGAATGDMIRKWERGIHSPSLFYVAQLCHIFNCTADQLGIREIASPLSPPPPIALNIDSVQSPTLRLLHLLTTIDHWRFPRFQNLQALVNQEIQRMDTTTFSRREALLALIALPEVLLCLKIAAPEEEMLARYAASITAGWSMYFEGGAEDIKPYLAIHLPLLATLAKTPSKQQKSVASLASQAYQLDYLLALQNQDFKRALYATQEALTYGEIAHDPNLLVASYVRRAQIYQHLKNPTHQMRYHESALDYIPDVSPLLKSWITMSIAENYASLHKRKEAERSINTACEHFPDHPEDDLHASYVPVTSYTLSIHETKTYLRLAQPEKALQSIQRVEQGIPDALVPRQVELLNQRLIALCQLGELDEVCTLFEVVERGARQSKLRYGELCDIYSLMCTTWPREIRVLELEDLLRR